MNDISRLPLEGPQLRTLLLTDLVDSTGLVERLGDTPASELFREHDNLVLKLQQEWRGRLIDRSDGLLLLFERPIDGLGFALDYTRGLRELGQARGVELQARAGLHVGEVLTWKNSDAAVLVGAKPLEVEGLAKPMAARLMTLARPGQILLSAVAESLTHRAARELGERGQNLLWKSYGRWRFKGVPEAQEIYEVGEIGIAPLRAPSNIAKAWRDTPLWRRPAALAAEILLVVGVGVGAWFVTRPQPAIAFAERDWVVVGDLRNLTGQNVLDDSLSQAFRISLEQSRYVNLLSDMKARDTLARMQRKPGTPLDRAIASEIALRDGVRAVILPTVSEVGGRVRVSAEVIDPRTQTTVYAESADGVGVGSALDSIDTVTGALRGKLGEALASIEKDSMPLPQATTSNLDALRAYALGVRAQAESKATEALQFYTRAVQLDPQFALAHLGISRVYAATDDSVNALKHVKAAQALRDHLSPRDQLYADAWLATFGPVRPMLDKWKLLSSSYPDYFAGYYNYAYFGHIYSNEYADTLIAACKATSEKNPLRAAAYHLCATVNVALEKYAQADMNFGRANELGMTGFGMTQASSQAARRRYGAARGVLAKVKETHVLENNTGHYLLQIALPLDQGNWTQATSNAAMAMKEAQQLNELDGRVFRAIELSLFALGRQDARLQSKLRDMLVEERNMLTNKDASERPHAAFAMLAAGYLGGRADSVDLVDAALASSNQLGDLGYPLVDNLRLILRAEKARLSGQPEHAIRMLNAAIDGNELYQAHVARLHAYADANRHEDVIREAGWLSTHRGRAYVEYSSHYIFQSLNVADSNLATLHAAEALIKLGRRDEARRELATFDRIWPTEGLPPYLRKVRADLEM